MRKKVVFKRLKRSIKCFQLLILFFVITSCIEEKTALAIHTPEDALKELVKGNDRFIKHKLGKKNFKEQINNTKNDQHPHSIILSCVDSRVPPEIIFDQDFGNIFVARVAGNVEDVNVLGSIEYAVKYKKTKLIIVMAHSNCGAIKGALDNVELGHLTQLVEQIKHSYKTMPKNGYPHHPDEISKLNAKQTVDDILEKSIVVQKLVDEGKVQIKYAFYDIRNGKVSFY